MHLEHVYPTLPQYLAAVQERLAELSRSDLGPLTGAARQATGGAAKRYRPALLLLCMELGCPADRRAVEYGAVIEAVHSASLVHDDVIDEADRRRGEPSLRAALGSKLAVLVGDYLVARSMGVAAGQGDLEIMRVLADTAQEMARAQVHELLATGSLLDEPTYLRIISGKTASLFACACQVGARLGGADEHREAGLREYGWQVGMAFQLADDLRDLAALPQDEGKPGNHDLATGKVTLPLIWTLREGDGTVRRELSALLAREGDDGRRERIRALVCGPGSDYAAAMAQGHVRSALAGLAGLPASPARAALATMAEAVAPCRVPAHLT